MLYLNRNRFSWVCIFFIFTLPPFFISFGMRIWENFLLTATLSLKITSTHHPMNRQRADETPSLCSWHSHFQECSHYAWHCHRSVPKHLQCSAFSSRGSFYFLRKLMSHLMLTWRRGVCGGGCGWGVVNLLSQVESAKQSKDSSATYIFILMVVDCFPTAASPSSSSSPLHSSIWRSSFPPPHFPQRWI